MSLERFAHVNLVILPILGVIAYFYLATMPAILVVVGAAYGAFAFAITAAWVLSKLSLALESSVR